MRLLIATGLYPPEIGGPATYSKLFEERLPTHDISVSVLPFRTVRHLPKIVRHIAYTWKLIRMSQNCDALLVQDTVSTGVPAAIVARVMRIPLIVRVPGDYAWEQGRQRFGVQDGIDAFQGKKYGIGVGMLRALQKFTVRSAVRVVAPSEYLAKIVRGWLGSDEKITVIYNGVELPVKTIAPKNRLQGKLIVSVGRLVPWKGFDVLIDVVKDKPEWNLVVIGDGPQESELKNMAESAGGRIQCTGALPREEMLGWCKAADVFVLNSSYEGLSHVLIEVMSLGTPIIATNVGGNPELIESKTNGILVESGDKNILREAIETILGDSNLAKKLGGNAAKRAADFSINKTTEDISILLREVVYAALVKGIHVVVIGADKNVFKEGSDVRERMKHYGKLFDSLRVIVFTKREDGHTREQLGSNITLLPTNSSSKLAFVYDAVRIGRGGKPMDIVTAQDPFESGLVGSFISKKFDAMLHVQVHTDITNSYFKRAHVLNRLRMFVARFVLPRADCIRVVSKRIKQGIEERYHIHADISVLPIFVDLEKYRDTTRKKHDYFGTTLLVVSRLEKEKNVALAIRALSEARKAGHDAGLIIVGAGGEKEKLQSLAKNLHIEEWVEFAGWQDPKEYYAFADLVLVPSHYEGYGMTIIEALAAGVPALSTDVGIAREAGAIVANEDTFTKILLEWFKNGERKGTLRNYPYKNEQEYLQQFKEDIIRCI